MRRAAKAAAWLCLTGLIALGPFWAASSAVSREQLVRRKYESWTGVLRMWKCEGWESGNGSLTAWLNECIAAFEKKHPGAYIQMTDVSVETLRAFSDGQVNPPDMLLYAPGMLDAPYSLTAMEKETPVRAPVSELGLWQEERYAVPVALGGYGLAINSRLIPETTSNWSGLEAEGKTGASVLNAPADSAAQSWSAALIALFAGSSPAERQAQSAPVGEGIDLGLATVPPERAEATEKTDENLIPNALPSALAENFRESENVYAQFTGTQTAAVPVTQREIRRLQLLSESGKAPDWRVECMGPAFTDQAALFSVTAWPRTDSEARRALAAEFLDILLSEKMQRRLTVVRAFSVLDTAPMYSGIEGLSDIENALTGSELLLPPAFGSEWRSYAAQLMDGVQAGGGTQEAYELLESMLRKGL